MPMPSMMYSSSTMLASLRPASDAGTSSSQYQVADLLELQQQYSTYKEGLQQLAKKIGSVEQEADEHKSARPYRYTPFLF